MTALHEASHSRRRVLCALQNASRSAFAPEIDAWLPAPLGRTRGRSKLFSVFYEPLREAFGTCAIVPEMVIADRYLEADWVAVMGSIETDQQKPYLGVPPGHDRCLRLGMFFRVKANEIVEMRVLFDLPALAAQAGIALLPDFPGGKNRPSAPEAVSTGCSTTETEQTRALITSLIGGLNQLEGDNLRSMPQQDFWTDDMRWHGPWGIGTCHGFGEYLDFAQGPSVRSFPNRRGIWPKDAFVVEGAFGAFTGWPSLVGDFTGEPFRGIAPTGGPISQNIMDFYWRRGSQLACNWVFIDLIDFARQCGVDLLRPLG